MINDANNYKHNYTIVDKRITYKDAAYNFKKGYKTVFANLYEFQQN
jgi:hypothetical protein